MKPRVVTTIEETRQAISEARSRGQTIGLVPTMGALHEGHSSLIRAARTVASFNVISIFVNPTQFGPKEDFARYPRPFDRDLEVCARDKASLVFHPEVATLYPNGFRTTVEVTGLDDVMCGLTRPGHFRGVATVVLKLLNIVQPDVAYFGQKDAQQLRIIQQLVADLDLPVRIHSCSTVREPDGLAISSRNAYLDADQRKQAPVLFRALQELKQAVDGGVREAAPLLRKVTRWIDSTPGAKLDYAVIVDYATLQPVKKLRGQVLAALAVFFGTTRLIDNVLLDIPA